MLIIGSYALKYHIDIERECADKDIIGTFDELQNFKHLARRSIEQSYPLSEKKWILVLDDPLIIEWEIAWDGSSGKDLLDYRDAKGVTDVAKLPDLLALKLSHRFLKNSPHFLKTMSDIQLMRKHGVTLSDWHKEWIRKREDETYTYKHPKLNKKKNEFFTDNVPYIYDHDDIHRVVALGDHPAYMSYQSEEVMCDKHKWDECPLSIKLAGVYEEACVLALERSIIPFKTDPHKAFLIALEKICTSITSGWFREFAWENYHQVASMYSDEFVSKFNDALQKGLINDYRH